MNAWGARKERARIEDEGVWCSSRAVPGWAFKLRRQCAWNVHHSRAMARIAMEPQVKAYLDRTRAADYAPTPEDIQLDATIQLRAFIEGHLVDWRGVYGPDSKAWTFSQDRALELFRHFTDVLTECDRFASNPENYEPLAEAVQGALALGNSQPASDTYAPPTGQASQAGAGRGANGVHGRPNWS